MSIDPGTLARLGREMSKANVVLFTGAGFSRGARSTSGLPVPGVWELKRDLWRIAFPGKEANLDTESLADIFGVAMNKSEHAVRVVLQQSFQIAGAASPDRYRKWFAFPWYRVYTLNIDDLDEAVAAKAALPRPVKSVPASINYVDQSNALLSVHLNGRLSDFPNVTFSPTDFAERLTQTEVWYHQAVADIMTHPVIYIGTSLDESGLWQHIELRRTRQPKSAEMRPRSYLVTPDLPESRAALLKQEFNVDWIRLREDEFFDQVLSRLDAESDIGHRLLSEQRRETRPRVVLESLRDAFRPIGDDDRSSYLLGREPSVDDVTEGFAVERSFESKLFDPGLLGTAGGVFLTGTTATGKTTTAIRLAVKFEADGADVLALNPLLGDLNPGHIAAELNRAKCEVLLIDNADVLGDRLIRLIENMQEMDPRPYLIATVRSSKLYRLDIADQLAQFGIAEATVPNLGNDDIDLLLDALSRANRLGVMAGMQLSTRRKMLRDRCGRQMVVAMYEATLGQNFHERVVSECEDLQGISRLAYGMVALTSAEGHYLSREELEFGLAVASNGLSNSDLNELNRLEERGLVLRRGHELRLRHRWIAETTVEFLHDNGIVGPPARALISSFAARVGPDTRWSSRESRILRRLINHDYLKRIADIDTVRDIYNSVEARLANNFHFWLQRGSLEVEIGDLSLAEVFLNSASSLAPANDTFVVTELAYLRLKKASEAPNTLAARTAAEGALKDLESVIAASGKNDSYPFHVYGSQGLKWARRGPHSEEERRALLVRLRNLVGEGTRLHPHAIDLRHLHQDLVREVLLQATQGGS